MRPKAKQPAGKRRRSGGGGRRARSDTGADAGFGQTNSHTGRREYATRTAGAADVREGGVIPFPSTTPVGAVLPTNKRKRTVVFIAKRNGDGVCEK
ncbi:hypothetical protein MRX96_041865 [Rhipicephalus microplus]